MPGIETIGRALVKIIADATGFDKDVEREVKKQAPNLKKTGEEAAGHFHTGYRKRSLKETEQHLAEFREKMQKWEGTFSKAGERIGRAFGRGSRNDFLNAFGGFMSLGPRMLSILPKLGDAFGALGEKVNELQQAGKTLPQALGSLASAGLPGLIAAAVAAAVAIKLTISLMGPLGAAVSLVTGLILALAGSLGFALVGALGAVAGALVPFAAAIGVAALAMAGLGKKNSGLKDLKKQFDDLKKTAAEGVFGKDGGGLANLTPILKGLQPLVKTVSTALGGLLTQLGEFGKSKGFQTLMADISKEIGPMVTQLGQIGGKFAVGLGQAFVDLGPIINEFLGWLDDIADKFVAFSKGGQKSGLADFFDRAWDSAKKVFGLVGDLADLIGTVFSAGKSTGDTIFDNIATTVKNIVTYLQSPEGQKALQQWFADAKKLADKLGDILTTVGNIIDDLDTPANRTLLFTLLGIANDLLRLLDFVIEKNTEVGTSFSQAAKDAGDSLKKNISEFHWPDFSTFHWPDFSGFHFPDMSGFLDPIQPAIDGIKKAFGDLGTWFGQQWDKIKQGWDAFWGANPFATPGAWDDFIQATNDMVDAIKKPFLDLYNWLIGNSLIPDLVMGIAAWFAKLPGLIAAGLGSLFTTFSAWVAQLPTKAAETVTNIVAAFSGLAGKLFTNAGDAANAAKTWLKGMAGKAGEAVQSIIDKFAGLAGKVFSKAGSFVNAAKNWLAQGPSAASKTANSMADQFSGLAKKSMREAGSLGDAVGDWGNKGVAEAHRVAQGIVNQFDGLNKDIERAIGKVTVTVDVKIPDIKRPTVTARVVDKNGKELARGGLIGLARGGFVTNGPTYLVGEAGKEAVVPLERALSRVDPAVRALSAIAQGLPIPPGSKLPNGGPAETSMPPITIITPTKDPRAVAAEVFNRFAAASYI